MSKPTRILPNHSIRVKGGRSKVWDYYGFYEVDGEVVDNDTYYCNECFKRNELTTYRTSNSTTVLAYHLEHQHKIAGLKEKRDELENVPKQKKGQWNRILKTLFSSLSIR